MAQSDLERAELIKTRLVYMWNGGRGESAESLAKIFGLSLDSVKKVLGIVPPPPPEPALARLFSHLRRRR